MGGRITLPSSPNLQNISLISDAVVFAGKFFATITVFDRAFGAYRKNIQCMRIIWKGKKVFNLLDLYYSYILFTMSNLRMRHSLPDWRRPVRRHCWEGTAEYLRLSESRQEPFLQLHLILSEPETSLLTAFQEYLSRVK